MLKTRDFSVKGCNKFLSIHLMDILNHSVTPAYWWQTNLRTRRSQIQLYNSNVLQLAGRWHGAVFSLFEHQPRHLVAEHMAGPALVHTRALIRSGWNGRLRC
jgi:hypothetical protein